MERPGRSRLVAAALVAAASFVLLGMAVNAGLTNGFDSRATDLVRLSALAWLQPVTEAGSTPAIVAVSAAVLVIGWLTGRWRDAMAGALAIGLGATAVEIIKVVVGRARPDLLDPALVETGFSFPSGHTANATVAYGVLAWLIGRASASRAVSGLAWTAAATMAFGVGVSRVWLGVHHPTDVLAGWLLGATILLSLAALNRPAPPGPGEGPAREDRAGPRSDPPAPG